MIYLKKTLDFFFTHFNQGNQMSFKNHCQKVKEAILSPYM